MTEPATPKLGKDDGGLLASILGFGLAAEVELLPGEIPLCAWDALFYRSSWRASGGGVLYLTTDRLVWIRWRGSLPWIAKVALVPLQYVERVEARRRFWSPTLSLSLLRPFRRHVVVTLKGGEQYFFSPASSGADASGIVSEITSILRERGLLRD